MRPGGPHLAALYGVAVKLPKFLTEPELKEHFKNEPLPEGPGGPAEKKAIEEALIKGQYYSHSLIKGNVEWGKEGLGTGEADYHDYFEIESAASPPLLRSRLTFFGTNGNGAFITNATSCPGHLTTNLTLEGPALVGSRSRQSRFDAVSVHDPDRAHGLQPARIPDQIRAHARVDHDRSAQRIHG